MLRSVFFVALAAALFSTAKLSAHGFVVTLDANKKLVLTSEDPTAGGRPLYKQDSLLGPIASRSHDHPGFDIGPGQAGITSGSKFTFDSLGPLWFADSSGAPQLAPGGITMLVSSQDPAITDDVEIRGASGFQRGFTVGEYDGVSLGAFEHQLNYELDVPIDPAFPNGVPVGAYAIALRLIGENGAGQPFRPSDPFVVVFNNKLPISTFPAIANNLFAAAVPEPGTLALALVGFGVAFVGARCRR